MNAEFSKLPKTFEDFLRQFQTKTAIKQLKDDFTSFYNKIDLQNYSLQERLNILEEKGRILRMISKSESLIQEDKVQMTLSFAKDEIIFDDWYYLDKQYHFDILRRFFRKYSENAEMNYLFDKTMQMARKNKVIVVFVSGLDDEAAAAYHTATNIVLVYAHQFSKTDKTHSLFHELIHSVSARCLHGVKSGTNEHLHALTPTQIQRLKEILELYDRVVMRYGSKGSYYGFVNVYEFLAELSNPHFRGILDGLGVLRVLIHKYRDFLEQGECDKKEQDETDLVNPANSLNFSIYV